MHLEEYAYQWDRIMSNIFMGLELEAIRVALLAFQLQVVNKHILVMCDNKTAVVSINKQGGTRSKRLLLYGKVNLALVPHDQHQNPLSAYTRSAKHKS